MNFIYRTRVVLINMGKLLPFVMCAIIALSYTETIVALVTNDFVEWNGYIIPNKRISWVVGIYFEYDFVTLAVFVIMSIAIETCIYNKLACLYLGVNLLEKSYFDFELEPSMIYAICIANIIVCVFFVYKGFKTLLK